ncbi:glutathione S-transferase family protein [Nannocystis sp. SCPEA4]|uniref:glutathione S-transferase family protein n=1 Tax=Nannocystis sp. SCPEA4 TaxID=2996787 RepID=UPI00226E1F98|nr:glutathione S-transferase family protein [Nannocystis sp. SCPEA4]MCY1059730.1 glutathione S-transferase family protein [Nannocystis sp. SCPEA4]
MPKLTYFDFPASRGEECRLALYIAGVAFEDERLKGDDWPARKEQTPYGSLPTLEVEGRGVLAQSNAILVYIGREHGLHPRDNWLAARHEELMQAVEELRHTVGPVLRIQDPAEKLKAREELAGGFLKRWGRNVERRLQELSAGPFVAGDAIHVADLKLYLAARWFSSGVVDHVPRDVFAEFPRLVGLERAVADHPKVVAWRNR